MWEKNPKKTYKWIRGGASTRCAYLAGRTGRGEVPVGRGALDETFDLAFDTELTTASDTPQAGVFLDCSICYERVPLHTLEAFALSQQCAACCFEHVCRTQKDTFPRCRQRTGECHAWHAAWMRACCGSAALLI
eukprot:6369906-Amphidinium_carterae.2